MALIIIDMNGEEDVIVTPRKDPASKPKHPPRRNDRNLALELQEVKIEDPDAHDDSIQLII